jgi:molybdopterin-guanine dinucleotide biosynthesis protein B
MTGNNTLATPKLTDLIALLDQEHLDLVLVEGFKQTPFTRIELHRPSLGHPLIYPNDPNVIAVASDTRLDTGSLPLLDINNAVEITEFVFSWLSTRSR